MIDNITLDVDLITANIVADLCLAKGFALYKQ